MPETSEQWRPVPGFDGRYEVSDLGRVRSWVRPGTAQSDGWKRRTEPALRRAHTNHRNNYRYVTLRLPTRYVTRAVHRMVLEAFVGPRPLGMEACHGDGDRRHNALSNLRWDTRSHNALDRTRHGTAPTEYKGLRDSHTGRFISA